MDQWIAPSRRDIRSGKEENEIIFRVKRIDESIRSLLEGEGKRVGDGGLRGYERVGLEEESSKGIR